MKVVFAQDQRRWRLLWWTQWWRWRTQQPRSQTSISAVLRKVQTSQHSDFFEEKGKYHEILLVFFKKLLLYDLLFSLQHCQLNLCRKLEIGSNGSWLYFLSPKKLVYTKPDRIQGFFKFIKLQYHVVLHFQYSRVFIFTYTFDRLLEKNNQALFNFFRKIILFSLLPPSPRLFPPPARFALYVIIQQMCVWFPYSETTPEDI